MKVKERQKDFLITVFGFSLASACFWALGKFNVIQEWQLKFGVYAGSFTMLIYWLRLKIAAEGHDPDSTQAFKEYIKLGSFYVFVLFLLELPIMLTSL